MWLQVQNNFKSKFEQKVLFIFEIVVFFVKSVFFAIFAYIFGIPQELLNIIQICLFHMQEHQKTYQNHFDVYF